MLKTLYIGIYDYQSVGSYIVEEYFHEILDSSARDGRGFVIVEATTKAEAKRKVFNATRGGHTDLDIEDMAQFLISLYNQNIDDSSHFTLLEKIYDKHIGDAPTADLSKLSVDEREGLFQDLLLLDKKILTDIAFWIYEESIFITDTFKRIT